MLGTAWCDLSPISWERVTYKRAKGEHGSEVQTNINTSQSNSCLHPIAQTDCILDEFVLSFFIVVIVISLPVKIARNFWYFSK